jgi:transposase
MSRFPTAGHLASWAGLCPGNHRSAGKRLSGKTRKSNQWLRTMLVEAAWSISHTKATILGTADRTWVKRLGKKKALMAVAHKLLKLVHKLLSEGKDYVEPLAPPQAT